MNKRLTSLVLSLVLLTPVTALADASSDGLGPSSASGSPASSSADTSALQPAGISQLQNTGTGSGQATTSDSGTLQQPATSNNSQLQVLVGNDSDGSAHSNGGSHPAWWYTLWIIGGLLVIAVVMIAIRRRRLAAARKLVFSVAPLATRDEERDISPQTSDEGTLQANPDTSTVEPDELNELESEDTNIVQNDEQAPPIIGTLDNKTGDSSGQTPQRSHKKGRKKHGRR